MTSAGIASRLSPFGCGGLCSVGEASANRRSHAPYRGLNVESRAENVESGGGDVDCRPPDAPFTRSTIRCDALSRNRRKS